MPFFKRQCLFFTEIRAKCLFFPKLDMVTLGHHQNQTKNFSSSSSSFIFFFF